MICFAIADALQLLLIEDGQNFFLAHDEVILTVDLDFLARILAKQNRVAVLDVERLPLDVKPGDTILFGKYAGQEVSVDGIDYLIMKEDDVLAIQERSL